MLRTYSRFGKCPQLLSRLCAFLAIIGGLSGCATRIAGLKHDPEFTYQRLHTDKLAVAGVVVAKGALDLPRESRRAELLSRQISTHRPDLKQQPTSYLLNTIGVTSYKKLLDEYRQFGFLSKARLTQLATSKDNARFIFFARIEKDDIENELDRPADETARSKDRGIIARTTRGLEVSFRIYDLQTLRSVWSGSIKKYDYNRKEYAHQLTAEGKPLDETKLKFPSAPTTDTVLGFVFRGFVENLPKKGAR
jgi:hypothetical protein